MMGDPNTRNARPPIRSFDLNEESSVSATSGRKRKLQDDDRIFPLSKNKFGDRFRESSDGSSIKEIIDADEHSDVGSSIGWNDCKRKDEQSDCLMGSFRESNRFASMHESDMMVDTGSRATAPFECASYHDQPSTSCGSNNGFRNSYSMGSSLRNKNIADQGMFELENVQDGSQSENEHGKFRQSLYEFEAFSNLMSSEIESSVIDKCISVGSDNLLPYHSGLTSISATQSLCDKSVARKPTIDQEFEQYFSSLML